MRIEVVFFVLFFSWIIESTKKYLQLNTDTHSCCWEPLPWLLFPPPFWKGPFLYLPPLRSSLALGMGSYTPPPVYLTLLHMYSTHTHTHTCYVLLGLLKSLLYVSELLGKYSLPINPNLCQSVNKWPTISKTLAGGLTSEKTNYAFTRPHAIWWLSEDSAAADQMQQP